MAQALPNRLASRFLEPMTAPRSRDLQAGDTSRPSDWMILPKTEAESRRARSSRVPRSYRDRVLAIPPSILARLPPARGPYEAGQESRLRSRAPRDHRPRYRDRRTPFRSRYILRRL